MIKIKSLAWIEDRERLFVVKLFDTVKRDTYYRPVGGTVEFGEWTLDTLHREIREELGTDVTVTGDPLILENIFTCDGKPGHEIVYLYPCQFNDMAFYADKSYPLIEDKGVEWTAMWIPIKDCLSGKLRLVPERLLERYR